MASIKEVKTRISSVVNTQQITKAMKMVSASKLRKSQDRLMMIRPFSQKLSGILQNISEHRPEDPWYTVKRPEGKVLIVAISSDRGLCGSFNANIIKSVVHRIEKNYKTAGAKEDVVILTIGKKVNDFFSKRDYNVIEKYSNTFRELSYSTVEEIGQFLIDEFRKKEFNQIDMVYNQFKNVATQVLITEQLLPFPDYETPVSKSADYIWQPNQEEILQGIVPKALKTSLYRAILESNASENGARMMAMDKATENASELLKELRLLYNRTRQASITKEILEIVGGAEALKSA